MAGELRDWRAGWPIRLCAVLCMAAVSAFSLLASGLAETQPARSAPAPNLEPAVT